MSYPYSSSGTYSLSTSTYGDRFSRYSSPSYRDRSYQLPMVSEYGRSSVFDRGISNYRTSSILNDYSTNSRKTSSQFEVSKSTTSHLATSPFSTSTYPYATTESTSYLPSKTETSFDKSAHSTDRNKLSSKFSNEDDDLSETSYHISTKFYSSSTDSDNESSEIQTPPSKGDGTVGLRNLGNTCFMNSILQCLSHTEKLRDYSWFREYSPQLNQKSRLKGKLFTAFANVLQDLWSRSSCSAAPKDLKAQIEKYSSRFAGYEQHDSQEFLRFLLEGLHEEINQVQRKASEPLKDLSHLSPSQQAKEAWEWYETKDKSFVFDLFVGQLQSSLKCLKCDHESLTYDPFWDLSLPIPGSALSSFRTSVSLEDCLAAFTKEELLDGDDKPYCENCNERRKMKKKLLIHKFPQILVIHLKRFKEGRYYRQKLSTFVDFPVKDPLQLHNYATECCEDEKSSTYQLYAVSNHSGSSYSGHYTAFCKNLKTKFWHEFNDSRVSEISEDDVCTRNAYVLFYAKKRR